MSGPTTDHYDVLGIPQSASTLEIRAAFLRLIREVHPDTARFDQLPDGSDAARIIAAYRCLHNTSKRASYDRERRIPRRALVLADHDSMPPAMGSLAGTVMRGLVGLLLIFCISSAIYLLSRDSGVIDSVFAAEQAQPSPAARLREQLLVEAGLDVDWVMTVHGPNMLGSLSRQCFSADPEHRSRAQCAYCIAFDDAAATVVPGDAYFGDRARSERREICPA